MLRGCKKPPTLNLKNRIMIKYKEAIDRGFKRRNLGEDSVWFDEYGYEWFVAEKKLAKLRKGTITANWCPETQTIEVMRIIDSMVRARKTFTTIKDFDEFDSFINPSEALWA
jgi:hypothetical protein